MNMTTNTTTTTQNSILRQYQRCEELLKAIENKTNPKNLFNLTDRSIITQSESLVAELKTLHDRIQSANPNEKKEFQEAIEGWKKTA